MPGNGWRLAALSLAVWTVTAAPALADGQLVIKSLPRGASVYVDGRAVGATPLVVNVTPGQHRIHARLQGYAPQATQVTAVDQLTTRATLSLERLDLGELRVIARPAGAQIYVDGRFAGQAPVYLKGLAPGSHRVVAVRDGFVKSVQTIDVVAGLTSTSLHALTAEPVRAAKAPAPRPTARPVAPPRAVRPQRPERPVRAADPPRLARAFVETPAATRDSAFTAPEPAIDEAFQGEPQAALAPDGLLLPIAWPSLPPLSPREIPFLLGMAALLAGLTYYFVFRWLPTSKAAPALFPARPPRGWLKAPGPAFDASTGAWEAGDVEGARAALWETVETGRAEAWHYYHLGLLAHREGKLADAESAYRTALQLDEALCEAGYNLGVLLADFHQAPQAVLAYRKHLKLYPEDVDAHFNLGHLYLALGMHHPASVHWTVARRMAPEDKELHANLVFLTRVMRVQRRTQKRAA